MDSDAGHDEIPNIVWAVVATLVSAETVSVATILDEVLDELAGVVHSWVHEGDIREDVLPFWGVEAGCHGSVELEVDGKFEFAAHGGDTTGDVGAVDRAAIPCIGGN